MGTNFHLRRWQLERLLDLLREHGPKTQTEIAEALRMTTITVRHYLRMLEAEPRRVRIVSYQTREGGRRPAALWGLGALPDAKYEKAPPPPAEKGSERRRRQIKEALEQKAMTSEQLADHICVTRSSIHKYLKAMKDERLVYIKKWNPPWQEMGGVYVPVYAYGNQPDAEREYVGLNRKKRPTAYQLL